MRLQPILIDLKKTKIDIPNIAIEPNNPQCINNFNQKQFGIMENQLNKYRICVNNFNAVCKDI